jgi:large subunit ribosomal protein L25
MAEVVLDAEVRTIIGKKSRILRREGKVPGVYYAHGEPNVPLSATLHELKPIIFTREAHLVNLRLGSGESKTCVLRDVQFDPLTDMPVHFDLQGVHANEELIIDVPVKLIGTPKGVKDGGAMQHILHRIKVACLPRNIPEHIELNVETLEINDSIHIRDLTYENIRFLESEDSAIVAVVPPTILKEETPVAAEAGAAEVAAEPEVIAKGKKPEEGAETPEKPEKKEKE